MKHATSLALFTYWQARQHRGGVRAGVIQAAELAPILPSLFLLDVHSHADPIHSFCGADIAGRYGRDLCHEPFLSLWAASDRDVISEHIRGISGEGSALVAGVLAETFGGGFTSFEVLLLPLSSAVGTAGLIGSMARVGGHEETNRVRARIISQSLRSARFLPPPHPVRHGDLLLSAAGGSRQLARRYGHLTVLPGGRHPESREQPRPLTEF